MGFWQRNTAMMRDPMSTGDFPGPAAAQKADANGPDLIQKYMNYFHQKDLLERRRSDCARRAVYQPPAQSSI
jgi:hypothetical protein